MDYVSTRRALYSPQSQPSLLASSDQWPLDAQCAELSRLAHFRFEGSQREELGAALTAAGFGRSELFDSGRTGTQAFATVRADGTAFVAFRGTQPDAVKDILADVRFLSGEWAGQGRVHHGFWTTYASIREPIDAWMASHATGHVVITGHSLGAALATVMTALHPRAELVTFGSPLVGDGTFAAQFAGTAVRRYVDCTDGITLLPPTLVGYKHVPGERYIDRAGVVHAAPPDPAFRKQDRRTAHLDYAAGRAWRLGHVRVRSLADHIPLNYLAATLGHRIGP